MRKLIYLAIALPALAIAALLCGCTATPGTWASTHPVSAILNNGAEAAAGAAARGAQGDWTGAVARLADYAGWFVGAGTASIAGATGLLASQRKKRIDAIVAGAPVRPPRPDPPAPSPPPPAAPAAAAADPPALKLAA